MNNQTNYVSLSLISSIPEHGPEPFLKTIALCRGFYVISYFVWLLLNQSLVWFFQCIRVKVFAPIAIPCQYCNMLFRKGLIILISLSLHVSGKTSFGMSVNVRETSFLFPSSVQEGADINISWIGDAVLPSQNRINWHWFAVLSILIVNWYRRSWRLAYVQIIHRYECAQKFLLAL